MAALLDLEQQARARVGFAEYLAVDAFLSIFRDKNHMELNRICAMVKVRKLSRRHKEPIYRF
jgi:hypothetical protein